MSAATEMVQAEWAARAVVLADLRRLADWQRRTGRTDHEGADIAVGRFLRALGHGAVADQWERVR